MSLVRQLLDLHSDVSVQSITARRFNQAQMLEWLAPILKRGGFASHPAGTSAEGRTIPVITAGTGPVRVFLWSQMHGDESTATMALLDMLNFFSLQPSHPVASTIMSALTLQFLPMLNPDGAERFQRRTAQQIDMNRDAVRLQTPEARLLRNIQAETKPHFGFNLHDQDSHYTVGESASVTAIALLAPPLDAKKSENDVLRRAKHLAAYLAETFAELVPGHLARYDDTFEPRAFGDNFQRWGTSTVLVESGGWNHDPEKMVLRKVNFAGLLCALHAIAGESFQKSDLTSYETLPFNGRNFFDILMRNVRFTGTPGAEALPVDIALNISEETDRSSGKPVPIATVVDIGDLQPMGAFQEFDCSGLSLDASDIAMDKRIPLDDVLRLMKKR